MFLLAVINDEILKTRLQTAADFMRLLSGIACCESKADAQAAETAGGK
jgi:hypothetical protein